MSHPSLISTRPAPGAPMFTLGTDEAGTVTVVQVSGELDRDTAQVLTEHVDQLLAEHVDQLAAEHVDQLAAGHVDQLAAEHVDQLAAGRVDQLVGEHSSLLLVLDLAGVDYLGAAGITALLHLREKLIRRGGRLVLREPSPQVRTVLRLGQVAELFAVDETSTTSGTHIPPQIG